MASNTEQHLESGATDVVVIGGGPVGLSLILHLDMYGVKTTLIESESTTRWAPKGNTNNVRTMELFRKLGIADSVRRLGLPADHPFDCAFFTRLSGFEIARGHTPSKSARMKLRADSWPTDQVPEPPHRANQMYLDRVLLEQAKSKPNITLKFGWSAESFIQDDNGVSVTARGLVDAERQTWRARYVVGCDGSRGLVRKVLGIKYSGEEKLMDVFIAGLFTSVHLRIPDLYPRFLENRRAWMYVVVNPDARANIITLNGKDEFMMHIPTKADDVISEQRIASMVKTAIGADVPVEILSHRQWNAGSYLVAERYWVGRAFLAGDAAHLYAPTGGFGMNTGIDDSSNLAWKLAASIQGWGGAGLLDTYEIERRAVALRNSDAARNLGKARHDVKVTSVVEEDSAAGRQARDTVARSDFVTHSHFTLPEERDSLGVILGARYDDSPVIVMDGDSPPESLETYLPSCVPGGRAPHLWLDEGRGAGSSLFDRFGVGFSLLRLGKTPPDASRLQAAADARGLPLTVVDVPQPYARELYDRDLYLIRPDSYIAWSGNTLPDDVETLLSIITGSEQSDGKHHSLSSVGEVI